VNNDLNLLGEPLVACSFSPLTGWFRDGCCTSAPNDEGKHHVCAIVTDEFLEFSQSVGNDLSTPRPEYGFAGLKAGDRWCLCATRWEEARIAGFAPPVVLDATNRRALDVTLLGHLQAHAAEGVPTAY